MRRLVSPLGTLHLNRTVRRTLVTLMYGVYVGLIIYWYFLLSEMPDAQLAAAQWLTLVGILTFTACYTALNMATQGLANSFKRTLTGPPLDERQLLLRNQAYFWAYLLLGVVAILFWDLSDDLGVGWTIIAFFGLYGSLPTALIAWLEPDPVKEETSYSVQNGSAT